MRSLKKHSLEIPQKQYEGKQHQHNQPELGEQFIGCLYESFKHINLGVLPILSATKLASNQTHHIEPIAKNRLRHWHKMVVMAQENHLRHF